MGLIKLRFFHTTDLDTDISTWRQVYPLGEKTYEYKKDKDQVFYRQDKKGDFVFANQQQDNETYTGDFDFFNNINDDLLERCVTRYIVTQRLCGGDWSTFHIGKFTMNDCDFDLDKCIISAKQNIVDEYTCFESNKKEEFNILSVAPEVSTFSPLQNNYEFLSCRNKDWLAALNKPCDATGGWKKFFAKTPTNTPSPRSTIFNDNTETDYYNCLLTKDHAAWIVDTGVSIELEVYRLSDNQLLTGDALLDGVSSAVIDKGMIGYTLNANADFKTYRPDTNVKTTIVTNNPNPITWFDVEDEQYAFYYDGIQLRAYDFSTGIDRLVDAVNISTGNGILNISYGDGALIYHDDDTDELKRYTPSTFLVRVIQSGMVLTKHLYSEDSFITWFDEDTQKMYLQNRDDTTYENILLSDNGGDCRWFARENEWIVFDDQVPGGNQVAINLINVDPFSVLTFGGATLNTRIENGWWLASDPATGNIDVVYLDTKIPTVPASQYAFSINDFQGTNPIFIAAGVERIYVYGKRNGAPFNLELRSYDMNTQAGVLVETLTNDLNCLLMNGYEQVLSTNVDRVDLLKENIQHDDELQVWFRELQKTICIGANPTQPAGVGWVLLRNQCNQFGTSDWVRQPALATQTGATVKEGGCLCTDEVQDLSPDPDECVSISPNSLITNLVMPATTSLTVGTIIGPIDGKQPIGGTPREVTWYIEKPRDGSTYTWSIPGFAGATIISGQGTDTVTVRLTSAFGATNIQCQEVNPCEAAPIPLATLPFIYYAWNSAAVTATVSIPVLAEVDTFSGGTVTFVRAFDNPWNVGGSSSVSGESSSSFSTDSKNRTVLTATHNGVATSVTWSGSQGGATFSESVLIVLVPANSAIVTPAEVCPTGLQTYRIENPRSGCVYTWTVDSPAFIVGSSVGTSVVVDMNGSVGTEQIHVQEVCPITPINYQLVAPCNELHDDSWWWILGNDIEYSHQRILKNVIEELVAFICPEITAVRSDFFQWNPLNPSLTHYVYGGPNQYNYLTISQKSDMRDPNASEPASIGNLTWEQFAGWLESIEVFYIIINGELHIEHISRFVGAVGIDTTEDKYLKYAEFRKKFSYAKAEMARREKYTWMEAQNADFVGFPIEYKDPNGDFSDCVNEETKDHEFKELTTDLKYIQTNPGQISNSGFVILANTFNGQDYNVISDNGIISGFPILNSPMSISVLQDRFMRHNRIIPFGWLNRAYTDFLSSQFFKKQEKFKIPLCCDTDFDPINLVRTNLGDGQVESAEVDYEDDTIDLKLKYE